MKKLLLALALLGLPALGHAVAAPAGLAVTPWTPAGVTLSWTDDAAVTQWYVYVNGLRLFSPDRYAIGTSAGIDSFNITGISQQALPAALNMQAVSLGQVSAFSANVTLTAASNVPFSYVMAVQPANASNVTLTATTAWTYALFSAPGDLTFQNLSGLTLLWCQTSTTFTPTCLPFQMAAGASPLNIPVSAGAPYFQWTYTASGGLGTAQAHR